MVTKNEAINNYGADSIQALEGLEAVRKRPAMYIGNTNSSGLAHIVFEIFDNAVDEALAGFCDTITLTFNMDGSVSIEDNGRGIPPEALELIFTTLHAGGKFDSSNYKSSGGLHGVGTSVTNAMSEWLEVTVYRGGKVHYLRFENGGRPVGSMKVIGKCDKNKSGSLVTFKPDANLFPSAKMNVDRIKQRTRETAFLNTTVKIVFNDFRSPDDEAKTTEVFDYNGLDEYLAYLASGSTVSIKPQEYSSLDEETGIETILAFEWIENEESGQENILSYVNNIRTKDGGTHETGFKTGITKAFNTFGKDAGLLKGKYNKVSGDDIREGIVTILSLKIPENILQFESQTKDKLGSIEARGVVENFTNEAITKFLSTNRPDAEYLIDRAIKFQKMKDEAKRMKDTTKKSNSKTSRLSISDKLTEPISKDPKEKELYMVEGDSAGGTAKEGRFNQFQGILALRGKVLNTENATADKMLANREIATLLSALGTGYGKNYDEDLLRYHKVIILTDADDDGGHIQTLLMTFFYRHMRKLVENGHLYIAQPPLYMLTKGKEKYYAWSREQVTELREQYGSGFALKRFKGLGEMEADQLKATAMHPETRILHKVTVSDFIQANNTFVTLMGKSPEARKVWIDRNVDFEEDVETYNYLEHIGEQAFTETTGIA